MKKVSCSTRQAVTSAHHLRHVNELDYLYPVLRTSAQITKAATKFSLVNILVKIPIERFVFEWCSKLKVGGA